MKKIIILLILIIPFLILGFVAYTNPFILPSEITNPLREIRNLSENFGKSVDRSIGIPINAKIFDDKFVVEEYVVGLNQPTTMTFVGTDIIILEKNTGKIKLIKDQEILPEPLMDFEVFSQNEAGLLGVTSYDDYVYFYVTESKKDGGDSIGNNIYQFEWTGSDLVNQKLVNTLSNESSWHNGGVMTVNDHGQVFAVIGDQMGGGRPELKNDFRILQNTQNGNLDDSGIILKVGFQSDVIKPMLSTIPLDHYYAIGIRNSYGLTIDPYTGNLWDTENGPDSFDEINLVPENFNSGWSLIMGPGTEEQISKIPVLGNFTYNDPEFSWELPVAPTGLVFADREIFQPHSGDLFVGSCNFGEIYKFELDDSRTAFKFNSNHLKDNVVNYGNFTNNEKEVESMDEILFANGFGCITDLEFGPDGNLYVVSLTEHAIYRIMPK